MALRKDLGLEDWEKFWEADLSLRDVFEKDIVYRYKESDWRRPFSISKDDKVTFESAVRTELSYVDMANEAATATMQVSESQFCSVMEGKEKDGSGLIRIIAGGQGSSGYYPEAVIERDGPLIFKTGTHMYYNHATENESANRPEGDLNQQAGVLTSNAYYDKKGPVGPGVYAKYKAFSDFKDKISERAKVGTVQISWKGWVKYSEGVVDGQKTKVITQMTAAESVDFVTRAGAGGAIARASESAGLPAKPKRGVMEITDQDYAALKADADKAKALEARVNQLVQDNINQTAKAAVEAKLTKAGLKGKAFEKTVALFLKDLPMKEGALDVNALNADLDEYVKDLGAEGTAAGGREASSGVITLPGNTTGAAGTTGNSKEVAQEGAPTQEAQIAQWMRAGYTKEHATALVAAGR
jgi:hypothetical protein